MAYEVTLITGDGTGPELAEAARKCVDATGVEIHWDVKEAGVDVMAKTGNPLPEETIASVRRTKCALKAPITTPVAWSMKKPRPILACGLISVWNTCEERLWR